MRASRARAAIRAQGGQVGREVPLPLPLGGLFSEAKTAEVRGQYAGEVLNWRSNGVSLEFRTPSSEDTMTSTAVQRIPFEFGGTSAYIVLKSTQATIGAAFIDRPFYGGAAFGYISNACIIADGTDVPVIYDGNAFTVSTFTASDGANPNTFDGITVHHDRVFFWSSSSLDFYYGGVGAITGTVTLFPLSRLGNITGTIVNMMQLTVTAGNNIEDALAIITSTGDVVIYRGLDPGDATDWQIVSRVRAAPPVARRGFAKVGSDVWMLSTSGLVSIRDAIARGRLALVSELSRPISDDILRLTKQGGTWQLHTAADGSAVYINHLLSGTAQQFTFIPDGGTWATTDYDARDFHNLGTVTEFTSVTGYLNTIDTDVTETITARWQSGWFRMPRSGGVNSITPTILSRGDVTMKLTVLSDHNETAADLAEAEQTVTLVPDADPDPGGIVSLYEEVAVDAVGSVFKIIMEITAEWADLVNLKANVS